MPQGNPEGYRYQRRPRHDSDESTELLKLALLEQEQTRPGSSQFRPGETPSNLAINAYLSTIPLSREQNREADVLDEMDRRYFQSREDRRAIDSQLEAQKGGATARQFAMRRGVEEDPSMLAGSPDPSQMRTIRRFSESAKPVDPDAAMTATQRAAIDPRVIAAGITAQGRVAAQRSAAEAKAVADKAKLDAKAAADKAKAAPAEEAKARTRQEIIGLAQELRDSPFLNANVGMLDVLNPITVRSGSSEWKQKYDRLNALLELEASGKLKGQGSISGPERELLSRGASALTRGTSENRFRKELNRIIESQGGTVARPQVGRFQIVED